MSNDALFPEIQPVDRALLLKDVMYRVEFDRTFIEFTPEDEQVLHAAAPLILPVTMEIVDGVYEHLFLFSNTKKVFLERETGYDGDLVEKTEDLTLEHPQMLLRKKFLTMWVAKIMTANFQDPAFWKYLDAVGEMHTGRTAFLHRTGKAPLLVDLQYLTLTLAWIQDVVLSVVLNIPRSELSSSRKLKILRAFNKIIAIQMDLFQRHYVRSDEEAKADLQKWTEANEGKKAGVDLAAPVKTEQEQERTEESEEEEGEAKDATDALPDVKV